MRNAWYRASYKLLSAGTITRISTNTGTVKAPYMWPVDSAPSSLVSKTGADTVIVTAGGNPRLLIYKAGCSGTSNWYDPVAAGCY